MKKKQRLAVILTAAVLALAPCAMASASLTAYASTLTVTDTEQAQHTYKAYQIITGTKAADGSLSGMAWGDAITDNGAALIAALNGKREKLGIDELAANATINQVAAALAKITDPEKVQILAKVFNEKNVLTTAAAKDMQKSDNDYTATGLNDGWYLVIDETESLATGEEDGVRVKSANLLQIVGDTKIVAKHSLPTVEKKILQDEKEVEANSVSIGDTVTYQIKTAVPDVRGYDKYFFVLNDTLSKGLTYSGNLKISYGPNTDPEVEKTPMTEDRDGAEKAETGQFYLVAGEYNAVNGTELKIVFEDCVNLFKDLPVNMPITVTYDAVLNENANITDEGNPNTVNLEYSNNPNADTDKSSEPETPDEPKPDAPTGKTPNQEVKTYTTALKLKKVDNNGTPLKGAEFKITGEGVNKVVTEGTFYVEDEEGTYYKLANGTYTTTAPESAEDSNYASTTKKYKIETKKTIEADSANEVYVQAFVDDNGFLIFTGLGDGEYKIEEVTVPDGYKQADPVTIEIKSTPDMVSAKWKVTNKKDGSELELNTENHQYEFEVVNTQFSTLPSTGGIGTKLFYLFGGMLAIGSGVLLVTKKRVGKEEQ